ncbi:MAG: adenylate/guanylate cyclase protein [Rhodospirillales bacterium]|nr:adenylate/guanylate cyclase protein [Rhodospirillales bacterium]
MSLRESFDDALGRRIIDFNIWALEGGLKGSATRELFDAFCQRLVTVGFPLWRGYAAGRTLHPQWSGYGYLWRREFNAIESSRFEHGSDDRSDFLDSPFEYLIRTAQDGTRNPWLRRRLQGPDADRDFPILKEIAAQGATDYVATIYSFGRGDPSHGTGVAYSFATARSGGFSGDDVTLLESVLPALSLAIKSHVGHEIAAGLLAAYLGADAGRRVHAGAVRRGTVETLRAVLWFADIRGFTATADATPGLALIDLLDDTFETMTSAVRDHGGQVLKFMGDGMLAIFPLDEASDTAAVCSQAVGAATLAMRALAALNERRAAAAKTTAAVDLALHLGEVLYGNVGAVDRLDFTVIGPAVNEVARIEALCEPLDQSVLVSAEFAAAAVTCAERLQPLGRHALRGVREPRDILALTLD